MVSSVTLSALVFALALATPLTWAGPFSDDFEDEDPYHWIHRIRRTKARAESNPEDDAPFWSESAQNLLRNKLDKRPRLTGRAKNVIMFLGDGLSVPTLAATRAYIGQKEGKSGEEVVLSFEEFPSTGVSKTYCVDSQVADSACSATAYLGGVKNNIGTIGVTGQVKTNDCKAMNNPSNQVSSILKWSQDAGKSTGVVTTTRVTHASPAGTYAHIANRDWENDVEIASDGENPASCADIAKQLVLNDPGKNIKVILGGGRMEFLPNNFSDEDGKKGKRADGANLIDRWKLDKKERNVTFEYVSNKMQLLSLENKNAEYTLGLFNSDHMEYHLKADNEKQPTLEEMTRIAILSLQKDPNGFFLFVEGGRIDMAHHDTKAHLSLDETEEFAKAVRVAVNLTNEDDTLIVVTSDHSHTMTISGYAARGNPIFGIAGTAEDKLPYATLSYANGNEYNTSKLSCSIDNEKVTCSRYNISQDDMNDEDYLFPSTAPLKSETHGGDDVIVFARGPWSHLYAGTFEQNFIPHAMAYASCVGDGRTMCDGK